MSIAFEARDVSETTEVYSPAPLATPRNAFSPEVVDKLLEMLATDDDFRGLFQQDARAALMQIGHETPEHQLGILGIDPVMCLNLNNGLASKDAIRAGRQSLIAALNPGPPFTVFMLSAN